MAFCGNKHAVCIGTGTVGRGISLQLTHILIHCLVIFTVLVSALQFARHAFISCGNCMWYSHRHNFRGRDGGPDPHFFGVGDGPHFISTPQAWSPTFQTKITPLVTAVLLTGDVLQSLVQAFLQFCLDCCNALLTGIAKSQMKRLQVGFRTLQLVWCLKLDAKIMSRHFCATYAGCQ